MAGWMGVREGGMVLYIDVRKESNYSEREEY